MTIVPHCTPGTHRADSTLRAVVSGLNSMMYRVSSGDSTLNSFAISAVTVFRRFICYIFLPCLFPIYTSHLLLHFCLFLSVSASISLCLPPSHSPPICFHLSHPHPSPRSRWRFECHCSLEVLTYIEILDSAHGEQVRTFNAMHFTSGVRRQVRRHDQVEEAEKNLAKAAPEKNNKRDCIEKYEGGCMELI